MSGRKKLKDGPPCKCCRRPLDRPHRSGVCADCRGSRGAQETMKHSPEHLRKIEEHAARVRLEMEQLGGR